MGSTAHRLVVTASLAALAAGLGTAAGAQATSGPTPGRTDPQAASQGQPGIPSDQQPAPSSAEVQQETARTDETNGIADIIVTASRRETKLQTTPIAVSAITGSQLQALGAEDIEDVARYTPGLTIQQATFSGASAPAIRGIGAFTIVPSASLPVAFYYDGLFNDRPYGTNIRLFDISRIEVLRGPQGVLFGRNATAGAIRVEYNLPTDELVVRGRASYGRFQSDEEQVSIRGPLTDWLKVGVAGVHAHSAGYGRNLFNGEKTLGYDVKGVRGAVVIDPTPEFRAVLRAGYQRDYSELAFKQIFGFASQNDALFRHPVLGIDEYANNYPGFSRIRRSFVSAELTYKFPKFDLIGLIGQNKLNNFAHSDTDGGDQVLVRRPTSIENTQRTDYRGRQGELRLSSTGFGALKLDLGLFYIQEIHRDTGQDIRFFTPAGVLLPGSSYAALSRAETNAYAVFGHAAYNITDQLAVRLGGRFNHEKKEFDGQGFNLVLNRLNPRIRGEKSWNSFTPLAGLDYKVSDTVFSYFTYSKGFKSGGFTTDNSTGAIFPFNPEKVDNYEIGLKTDLFGRTLRFNTAAFYTNYNDLQVTQNLPAGAALVTNAGKARIYGVETETVWRPIRDLTFTGSLAYLHARYRDYVYTASTAVQQVNLKGEPLDRAPDWKASLIGEYEIPTRVGTFAVQGSVSYEDYFYFQSTPDSPVALAGPPASPVRERSIYYRRPAITLFDARVQWTSPDRRYALALYGMNLSNKRYFGATTRLGGGTSAVGTANMPRTWRAEFSFNF